jgi:HSP20 family protein
MTLTKYKRESFPTLIESLLKDGFGTFPEFISTSHMNKGFPATNAKETEKSYEIELVAPGLSKDEFKVTVEEGVLRVSSEMENRSSEEGDGYIFKEFSYKSFSRSFKLPENVDKDNIEAKYENGILKLEVKKLEETKKSPKLIEVL